MVNNLRVFYQNVRGIRTKTNEIYNALLNTDFDIIVFTETWLNKSVYSSEFIDNRYNVYRRDRESSNTSKLDGGGVLIAVTKRINSYRMTTWETKLEDLWVNILIGNSTISICAVYIPSPLKCETLDGFVQNVEKVVIKQSFTIIIGDFNIPSIQWAREEDNLKKFTVLRTNFTANALVKDFMDLTNLSQVNGIKNNYGKILDLVFTNMMNINVQDSDTYICSIDKYHPPLELNIEIDDTTEILITPKNKIKYAYFNADYEVIKEKLGHINWERIFFNCNNIDDMVIIFYEELRKIIELYVPKKVVKNQTKYPVWYSRQLIRRLKEKNKYRLLSKKYGNPLDEIEFKLLRDRCRDIIDTDYKRYIENIENNIKINPKFFYSYQKNLRNQKCDYPALMTMDNCNYNDGKSICDQFAKHFSSIYSNYDSTHCEISTVMNNSSQYSQIIKIIINKNEILNKLKSVNVNKGTGPDNIPPIFVKRCASALVDPLSIIYQNSIDEGKFPSLWKKARVVPIFKNGDRKDIKNYRPVSILSIFSKIFESLLSPFLTWPMKSVITHHQHGFVKNRSTMSNLATFVNNISNSMDNNYQVDCIYTDLAKAFDVVDHNILMNKLQGYGFNENLLKLLHNYLQQREMNVVMGGYESCTFSATSGVPQGSCLGPILFGIFINDVVNCFHHSKIQLYADDLKMYRNINSLQDSELLQLDLDRFAKWCRENHMNLNQNKCYILTFSRKTSNIIYDYKINEFILNRVNQTKDLGITVDSKMSFIPHIDELVSKSLKILGFIKRSTKVFKKSNSIITLFNSFIRSKLEYCSVAWSPFYQVHIDRIERIQKRLLKFVRFKDRNTILVNNYGALLKHYNMIALKTRRDMLDLCFLHKIISGNIDCPQLLKEFKIVVPRPNARNAPTFKCRFARTNLGVTAPLNRAFRTYNNISKIFGIDIYNDNLKSYKAKIKDNFKLLT